MKWEKWEPIYQEILEEFGYDRQRDEEAAIIAEKISAENEKIDEFYLGDIIKGRIVSICGAVITEKDVREMEGLIFSADEATSFLLRRYILPDIIVTDLDGCIEDILKANERGSIAIIHAHGDNIDAIKKYLPKFKGKIMLTTQSKPLNSVYNFGGFTDGDRAYCIARHFNAKEIKLFGFDFLHPKPKKGKNIEIKMRKLKWAKKIIRLIEKEHRMF